MINKRINQLCKEYWLIENYEKAVNDDTQMYECHHRIEISEDGLHTIYSAKELYEAGLVWNRQPEELIFLTKSDHQKLHGNTIEFKEKISETHKGKCHSEETKKKIADARKGKHLSDETKKKIAVAIKAYLTKKKMENQ